MSKTMRFSSLFLLLAFGAACGGQEDVPAAEDAQPAAESSAPAPAAAMEMDYPEGVTAEMVAQGEAVFTGAGICFTCHMPGGVGGPLAPNLTDGEWINTEDTWLHGWHVSFPLELRPFPKGYRVPYQTQWDGGNNRYNLRIDNGDESDTYDKASSYGIVGGFVTD